MDDLKQFLKDNPALTLVFPSLLSLVQFIGEVCYSAQSGIGFEEFKSILASASGLETLVLASLMYIMRPNK